MRITLSNKERKEKLSINVSSGEQFAGSLTSMMEEEIFKSRQMLTSQGILNLAEDRESQQLMNCFNKLCSSKEVGKYL